MAGDDDARVLLRARREGDVPQCLAVLEHVHDADGYPSTLEQAALFLTPDYEVASWVADRKGVVVGHVALHAPLTSETLALAATRLDEGQEAYVLLSRLFVAPSDRGRGTARSLLEAAVGEARAGGRRAVLDVDRGFDAAIALYESEGWVRLGSYSQSVGDEVFDVWVYAAPAA